MPARQSPRTTTIARVSIVRPPFRIAWGSICCATLHRHYSIPVRARQPFLSAVLEILSQFLRNPESVGRTPNPSCPTPNPVGGSPTYLLYEIPSRGALRGPAK